MKLLDANVLIYAVDSKSSWHDTARPWLERLLSGAETVALPWAVLLAFIRISTKSSIFESPLTAGAALDLVDGWLTQPCTTVVYPTERHSAVLRELLEALGTAGNLASDAHLAALAIEHGAQLCSTDTDFARFPGLRWVNPLRES